ncbi:MAG TPA: M28 family metallopeptidase [Candidatus Acidoferrum sp.]|jgi:Zn-dependent M28 family amino/carboxypeptidase
MKIISRLLVVLIFFYSVAAAATDWDTKGKAWWAHVQYLADDKLEGRGIGTEGFAKAADYVTDQFQKAGLQPAGVQGYAQNVDFNVLQLDEANSSTEFIRNGKPEKINFGVDGFLNPNANSASVDAPAVFIGYGLKIPEANFDDFAGQDLQGKIVVYVSGGPSSIATELKAHYQSMAERRKNIAASGAVGVIAILNPKSMEVPWSRIAGARLLQRMELASSEATASSSKLAMVINPEHADKVFAGSGHTFAEITANIGTANPLPHFALPITIRATTAVKRSTARSQNLIGVLPGSDPQLKNEYVAISAHLDHLGIGESVNGDNIYNGAMDDASGVASVIEIAKAIHNSGAKPKRSILFLAVTAEEKGLLGSEYFSTHPTVKGPIVANINMDMYLPLFPLKFLEVQGLGESTLGEDITAVARNAGVIIQADKQPDHVRFIRSDQYSFIKQGVPSLAFKFGWLPGTPEEKLFDDWYKERYHGPKDDPTQPVDAAAAAQFNAILEKLALRVADSPTRPTWNSTSFFRRFAR